ncbi:MAG: GtrA family protein [Bacteroidales bacterium]|nr:GtrA family protein [Candidatus Colicola faecequi]
MLPSSRLQEPYKSAVRFTVVGSTGTLIQYAWYWIFLLIFEHWLPAHELTTLAFTIGFVLEMISNYCLTAWYTFESKPSIKNLGGFLTGRAVNYLIQISLLHFLLWAHFNEEFSGFAAILIAGIINYFVVKIFFRKEQNTTNQNSEE